MSLGNGRPGWHIECAAIALANIRNPGEKHLIDIQGGGSDLIFPHHEMSAAQVKVLTGKEFAHAYVHSGLLGLDGEKMSKSKGNLVFVSQLLSEGVKPMVIRWALLKRHYRNDYMWMRTEIKIAEDELIQIQNRFADKDVPPTDPLIQSIGNHLANDLDTPKAIQELVDWSKTTGTGGDKVKLRNALDLLLGLQF